MVYDYHPNAVTLYQQHLSPQAQTAGSNRLSEKMLWSYIGQLVSAVKMIHASGLACRVMEPSKILITGKNRLRINCCGLFDMISFDSGHSVLHFQQEDLLHLGQLIVALACGGLVSLQNISHSLQVIGNSYPIDLKNIIIFLLSPPSPHKSIDEVITFMGQRILLDFNAAL